MGTPVDTVRRVQECFNARDWERLVACIAYDCHFVDPQGQVLRGKVALRQYAMSWAGAFSNAWITEPQYYEDGDTVVTTFVARGTHDGHFGPVSPTGRCIALPYCEVWQVNLQGRLASGRAYVDLLGLMAQLGVARGPVRAGSHPAGAGRAAQVT